MNKRLRAPINVQIEVTSKCTSECIHCYNFWRKEGCGFAHGNFDTLSKDDAKSIMQKLGDVEVFQITITGGEPLMNYQTTLLCIELAWSMNMGVGLNSNMVLLTKKRAVELKRAGLSHILTSILGPSAEIHDRITQRPKSFEKLIKNVRIAHDAGLRVSANMVVSQFNFDQVRATAEVVAELGIKSFMATKAGCPGNCSDFSQIAPNREQLVAFLNDLCWARENLKFQIDTLEPIPLCGLHGVKLPDLFTRRKCTAGVTTMTVSYDGSVRPCSHLDESYGNMLVEDLATVWARMGSWSQMFQIPTECSSCEMLNRCGSGCRMEAKTRTGKINGLDPFTQVEHVKEMAEILKPPQKLQETTQVKSFKTPRFKLRRESFGGVFVAGVTCAYLDHRGFEVLKQFDPETTYDVATTSFNWNGLVPEKFVSGLVRRRMVTSVQNE